MIDPVGREHARGILRALKAYIECGPKREDECLEALLDLLPELDDGEPASPAADSRPAGE